MNFGPGLRYALMGPNLIYQLGGGQHGIEGLLKTRRRLSGTLVAGHGDLEEMAARLD